MLRITTGVIRSLMCDIAFIQLLYELYFSQLKEKKYIVICLGFF